MQAQLSKSISTTQLKMIKIRQVYARSNDQYKNNHMVTIIWHSTNDTTLGISVDIVHSSPTNGGTNNTSLQGHADMHRQVNTMT